MITIDQELCAGCTMCVTACAEDALSYKGMIIVIIDACLGCLECLDYCPTRALSFRVPVRGKHAKETI